MLNMIPGIYTRHALIVLLSLSLMVSWNVGSYLYEFYFNEIILALILVTYVVMVFSLPIEKNLYYKYVVGLPLVVLLFSSSSALAFSLRFDAAFYASFLAQRKYLILLILPVMLIAVKHNMLKRTDLIMVFLVATISTIFVYYGLHYGLDFQAIDGSDDRKLSSLISNDPWRGYRLRIWAFPVFMLLIYLAAKLVHMSYSRIHAYLFILMAVLASGVIIIHVPRQLIAAFIFAIPFIYFVAKNWKVFRITVVCFLIAVPAASLVMWAYHQDIDAMLAEDGSYSARLNSYRIAGKEILKSPLLGAGTASYATKSYKELFGKTFYPSDIGIVGVVLRYGIFGALFYMLLSIYVFVRILQQYWKEAEFDDKGFVYMLLVASFVTLLLLPIQAVYAYQGMGILALMFGYIETHQYRQRQINREQHSGV